MRMRLRLPRNNQIDDHFGHCEFTGYSTYLKKNEVQELQP